MKAGGFNLTNNHWKCQRLFLSLVNKLKTFLNAFIFSNALNNYFNPLVAEINMHLVAFGVLTFASYLRARTACVLCCKINKISR